MHRSLFILILFVVPYKPMPKHHDSQTHYTMRNYCTGQRQRALAGHGRIQWFNFTAGAHRSLANKIMVVMNVNLKFRAKK